MKLYRPQVELFDVLIETDKGDAPSGNVSLCGNEATSEKTVKLHFRKLNKYKASKKAYTKIISLIFLGVIIVGAGIAIPQEIKKNIRFFPEQHKEKGEGYYQFLNSEGIRGKRILTTDPLFAAQDQHNNLFIPLYENVEIAQKKYKQEKERGEYDYLIYNTDFFPCQNEACSDEKEQLEQDIFKNHEMVYPKAYQEKTGTGGRYIFKKHI